MFSEVHRYARLWFCLALVVGFGFSGVALAESDRADLLPLAGQSVVVDFPFGSADGLVIDDVRERIVVSSSSRNAVAMYDFSGNLLKNATVTDPSSLTLNDGKLFAVQSSLGRIVELSTSSLDLTVLHSGLLEPRGLAFAGPLALTTISDGPGQRALQYLGSSGSVRVLRPNWGQQTELFTFPSMPNVVFGQTKRSFFTFRFDDVSQTLLSQNSGRPVSGKVRGLLADGDLLIGNQAVDAQTLTPTGRIWNSFQDITTFPGDMAVSAVAVAGLRSEAPDGPLRRHELRLYSTEQPGKVLRTDVFEAGDVELFMARDGSRVVALESARMRLIPGVGSKEIPQAPGSTSPRGAAPQAPGGSGDTRGSAPQVLPEPTKLSHVTDLQFDPVSGLAFAVDPIQGMVGVFSPDGLPVTTFRNIGSPRQVVFLNSNVFTFSMDESRFYELDLVSGVAKPICAPISRGYSAIVAAGGRLWIVRVADSTVGFFLVGVDPLTCDQFQTNAISLSGSQLSEAIGDTFFVGPYRFNAQTRTYGNQAPNGVRSVLPADGSYLDSVGVRRDFATDVINGGDFGRFRSTTSSGTSSNRFASVQGVRGFSLSIESETRTLLYLLTRRPFAIQRVAFRPGTNELWVAAQDLTANEVVVGPLVDAGVGQLVSLDTRVRPLSYPQAVDPSYFVSSLPSTVAPEELVATGVVTPEPVTVEVETEVPASTPIDVAPSGSAANSTVLPTQPQQGPPTTKPAAARLRKTRAKHPTKRTKSVQRPPVAARSKPR
jgi:hypothetical protein